MTQAAKNVVQLPEPRVFSAEFAKEYILNISGKDAIKVDGLILMGHAENMKAIKERITEYPRPENNYTCFAESIVIDKDGNEWIGIGDANVKNCTKKVAAAAPRMAGTRATGRALRRMLGIQMVAFEEIDTYDDGPNVTDKPKSRPMTSEQKQECKQLFKQKGLSSDEARRICMDVTGFENSSKLDEDLGDLYIKKLRSLPDAPTGGEETVEPGAA